jgi:hypothetical protein
MQKRKETVMKCCATCELSYRRIEDGRCICEGIFATITPHYRPFGKYQFVTPEGGRDCPQWKRKEIMFKGIGPCPVCETEAIAIFLYYGKYYWIKCANCGMRVEDQCIDGLKNKWNKGLQGYDRQQKLLPNTEQPDL